MRSAVARDAGQIRQNLFSLPFFYNGARYSPGNLLGMLNPVIAAASMR